MQRQPCITCNLVVTAQPGLKLLLVLVALVPLLAGAQVGAQSPQSAQLDSVSVRADCSAQPYRDFDFWLGRWEVHLADGKRAGSNLITASDDGCLIEERWSGAQGGRGYSMNFYEPGTSGWRQLWVSRDVIIEIAGQLVDGSMVLTGTISYRGSGETRPFRGRWTPLDDGRVRQFFEERVSDTWQPWFEGFYSKVVE
jgi:hypothetical protein